MKRKTVLHKTDLFQFFEDSETLFAAVIREDISNGISNALQSAVQISDEEVFDELPPDPGARAERTVCSACTAEKFSSRDEPLLTPFPCDRANARGSSSAGHLQEPYAEFQSPFGKNDALSHQRTESPQAPMMSSKTLNTRLKFVFFPAHKEKEKIG